MDTVRRPVDARFGEFAVYLALFSPALYFGGVRTELIQLIQLVLLASFWLDHFVRRNSSGERFRFYGKGFSTFNAFLFLFVAWLAIRTISIDNFYDSVVTIGTWLTALLIYLTVLWLPSSFHRRQRTLFVMFVGSGLLALAHFLISYRGINPRAPFVYFLFHGFHFHGYIIQILGFGFMMMLLYNRYSRKVFLVFGVSIVDLLSLVYYKKSGAFSGLMVLISILIFFFYRRVYPSRRFGVLLIVLLAVVNMTVLLGIDVIVTELSSIFPSNLSETGSRLTIYRATLNMFTDHVLAGVGTGKFGYRYPLYRDPMMPGSARYAHSDPLQLLAEYGVIGFLLAILTVFFFGAYLFKHFRLIMIKTEGRQAHRFGPTDFELAFFIGGIAGLGAVLGISLTDFELQIPANLFLSFWIVGELCSLIGHHVRGKSQDQSAPKPLTSRFSPRWRLFILTIGSLIMIAHNSCLGMSEHFASKSREMAGRNEGESLNFLRRSVSWYPLNHDAWYQMSRILMTQGRAKLGEAAVMGEKAIVLSPQDATKYSVASQIAEMRGNLVTAREFIVQALRYDPRNLRYLFVSGSLALKTGDIDSGLDQFKTLIDLDPLVYPKFLGELSTVQVDDERLQAMTPQTTGHYLSLAEYLAKRGNTAKVYQLVTILLDNPLQDQQLPRVIKLLDVAKQYGQVEQTLKKIVLHPEFKPDSRFKLQIVRDYIKAIIGAGRLEEAYFNAESFRTKFPQYPELWVLQAELAAQMGQTQRELSLLSEGLVVTDSPLICYQLGKFYEDAGEYVDAFRYYQLAWMKDQTSTAYVTSLIDLYIKREMYLQARLMCDEVLAKIPDNLAILQRLQRIYETLELKDKERAVCQQILHKAPGDEKMRKRLAKLDEELNDTR